MTDTRSSDYAALALRLSLGTLFAAHALLKYFVFTPASSSLSRSAFPGSSPT